MSGNQIKLKLFHTHIFANLAKNFSADECGLSVIIFIKKTFCRHAIANQQKVKNYKNLVFIHIS